MGVGKEKRCLGRGSVIRICLNDKHVAEGDPSCARNAPFLDRKRISRERAHPQSFYNIQPVANMRIRELTAMGGWRRRLCRPNMRYDSVVWVADVPKGVVGGWGC
jgi:hypothetical protein